MKTSQLFLIVLILTVTFTLTNTAKGKIKQKKQKIYSGPANMSVYERGLIEEHPAAQDIILQSGSYYYDTSIRQFNGTVLGYVTPWNNHGYDVAKIFANKFTHISPVWLQIRRTGPLKYSITGLHDIDESWIRDVQNNGNVKIVPRVLFDGWTGKDYQAMLSSDKEKVNLAKSLVKTCETYKFQGVVLEVWSQLAGAVPSSVMVEFLRMIALKVRSAGYEVILVVPPHRSDSDPTFTMLEFDQLYNYINGFSLMTYDYSSIQKPGPNSPYDWIRACVKALTSDLTRRKSILLGLNFYGYDFTSVGGEAIVSGQYLELLNGLKSQILWDRDSKEHFFETRNVKGNHYVFYPTLLSIQKRIELAQELGTGLSVWELGQGLDYFYDLL